MVAPVENLQAPSQRPSLRDRLTAFAQRAVIFAETRLNPFGCGYVKVGGKQYEVHDHSGSPMVETPGGSKVLYDEGTHGELIAWLDEGQPLTDLYPATKPGIVHNHQGNLRVGAHECS